MVSRRINSLALILSAVFESNLDNVAAVGDGALAFDLPLSLGLVVSPETTGLDSSAMPGLFNAAGAGGDGALASDLPLSLGLVVSPETTA